MNTRQEHDEKCANLENSPTGGKFGLCFVTSDRLQESVKPLRNENLHVLPLVLSDEPNDRKLKSRIVPRSRVVSIDGREPQSFHRLLAVRFRPTQTALDVDVGVEYALCPEEISKPLNQFLSRHNPPAGKITSLVPQT